VLPILYPVQGAKGYADFVQDAHYSQEPGNQPGTEFCKHP